MDRQHIIFIQLVPSIYQCITHRSYTCRKYGIYIRDVRGSIFRCPAGPDPVVDANLVPPVPVNNFYFSSPSHPPPSRLKPRPDCLRE